MKVHTKVKELLILDFTWPRPSQHLLLLAIATKQLNVRQPQTAHLLVKVVITVQEQLQGPMIIELRYSVVTIDSVVVAVLVLNEFFKHRYITLEKLQVLQVQLFSAQSIQV